MCSLDICFPAGNWCFVIKSYTTLPISSEYSSRLSYYKAFSIFTSLWQYFQSQRWVCAIKVKCLHLLCKYAQQKMDQSYSFHEQSKIQILVCLKAWVIQPEDKSSSSAISGHTGKHRSTARWKTAFLHSRGSWTSCIQ